MIISLAQTYYLQLGGLYPFHYRAPTVFFIRTATAKLIGLFGSLGLLVNFSCGGVILHHIYFFGSYFLPLSTYEGGTQSEVGRQGGRDDVNCTLNANN